MLLMPRKSPNAARKLPASGSGELALIERIRHLAAPGSRRSGQLRLGIGDDCAILHPRPGEEMVVTTDFSLEGRHFRRDWHPPRSVGHRTLARGLSDLAAMGARPAAAFLSLALPKSIADDTGWLDQFFRGLMDLANAARVPLAGGDTSEAPGQHILADIVLLGACPEGRALRRDRAHAGDRIFCTGALGGAAAELRSLAAKPNSKSKAAPTFSASAKAPFENPNPHLFPAPRLAAGQTLLRRDLATAAIDLSDGLSTDLHHLCAASRVAAEIDAASLPLHRLASKLGAEEALRLALNGGEDYELLFTAPADARVPKRLGAVPITEIGRIVPRRRGQPVVTLVLDGTRGELKPHGWEHLR